MATEATVQVLGSAVETAGVSIVTATRTVADPRNGAIYNPTTFAAAVPVWFHRLHDGRHLALFSRRWYDATSVYHDGPQMFSDYSEDLSPSYAYIDPTTGVAEGPYTWVGLDTLTAAVSRSDYLFTLGTLGGDAVVQHWVITRNSGLQLQGSEVVPMGYTLGLYADDSYLHVFGADGDGKLAHIRKHWGRIGVNIDAAKQWEYEGTKGWYVNSDEGESMRQLSGLIPVAGPVSMAKFRDRLYLTVTEHVAGAYSARTYTTRAVDAAWQPVGTDVVPLGDDTTYLGSGAYLQPQLVTNKALLPDGASNGFPYVTSVRVVVGTDDTILTEWGILTV